MRYALFLLTMFAPLTIHAATGDVLYQCTFDGGTMSDAASVVSACIGTSIGSPSSFNTGTQHTAAVVTGGHDGGRYIKVTHASAPSDDGQAIFMVSPSTTGLKEWTVTYWEKFDHWPIASPNIKGSRVYHSNSGGYYGAVISAHSATGRDMYISPWESATVEVQTQVINRGILAGTRFGSTDPLLANYPATSCNGSNGWGSLCVNATHTSTTAQYYFPGPATGSDILAFDWTTDGITNGYGSDVWHKIRLHTKLPSMDTATDGAITMWIDEKLAFSATNVKSSAAGMAAAGGSGYPGAGGATLTSVKFYPSEYATEAFAHSYDDIAIYEGYVPPTGGEPSPPTHCSLIGRLSGRIR